MASRKTSEAGRSIPPRPHSVPVGAGLEHVDRESPFIEAESDDCEGLNMYADGKCVRRYYVEDLAIESKLKPGESREGKTAFLKHFDIELDPAVVKMESSNPAG
jgi:hypothetical protein